VNREFEQISWDEWTADDCRQIIRLAVREDLDRFLDVTTVALVASSSRGAARLAVREPGVVSGLPAAELVVQEMNLDASCEIVHVDGSEVMAATCVARLAGSSRDLLTAERLILNLVGRLSGVATLTRRFVDAVVGTGARIYDTRKTTPGWRRLEKYAVRCGGGHNHRTGLFDAVLIKDNHLATGADAGRTPADAVRRARTFLRESLPERAAAIIEVEVDTLDQFQNVLDEAPDIILLDNMSLDDLRHAVSLRDASGIATQLEASGGVHLETVREIAHTGVDRISVGALTHSATSLDVGLDWGSAESR
jgi:nicotinate-nucleotide pyrophosphorylase (carboxylating)